MDEYEHLTPEFCARLLETVERVFRVRREIILLAGHASGHLPGAHRMCRKCRKDWPCQETTAAARSALDAFADV